MTTTEPSTDRELVCFNRLLMTDETPTLCSQVYCDKNGYQHQTMKAFWLTTDGRLVHVDRASEDIKFRYLRQQNLRVALSLWTTNPELCGQTMRDSALAHNNLIRICGEAARLSQGRFYNLYANYPLPINDIDGRRNGPLPDIPTVDENTIDAKETRFGGELLLELQPLYASYFSFITDTSTSETLKAKVALLDAQWLVKEDCSELLFSLDLRTNLFTRIAIMLALALA